MAETERPLTVVVVIVIVCLVASPGVQVKAGHRVRSMRCARRVLSTLTAPESGGLRGRHHNQSRRADHPTQRIGRRSTDAQGRMGRNETRRGGSWRGHGLVVQRPRMRNDMQGPPVLRNNRASTLTAALTRCGLADDGARPRRRVPLDTSWGKR